MWGHKISLLLQLQLDYSSPVSHKSPYLKADTRSDQMNQALGFKQGLHNHSVILRKQKLFSRDNLILRNHALVVSTYIQMLSCENKLCYLKIIK